MAQLNETIDIQQYHKEHIETLSEEENQAIRETHVERAKQGHKVWNAWAEQVLIEIEKTYPKNADEEEKLAIRNQYFIDFTWIDFNREMDFSFFNFPINVNFRYATFSGYTKFWQARFSGNADFRETKFSDAADFRRVTFSGDVNFWLAEFSGNADFGLVRFSGVADFSSVPFLDGTDFGEAIFSSGANFRGVKFSYSATFDEVTFSDDADFRRVTFSSGVNFRQATFTQDANFKWCKFIGKHQNITFLGAEFKQQSFFIDTQFSETAQVMPCDFRQTYFHLPPLVTDFPSDVSIFIQANKDKQRDDNFYKDCEARFRELKKLAEGNNNYQKSLEFYGCELYCQRRASGGGRNLKNWASCLYGLLSGYGLSLLRPTLLWLVVMLGSMGLQACFDDKLSFSPTATINIERVGFYLSPSLPPFINKPLYQKEVRHRLYVNPQGEKLKQLCDNSKDKEECKGQLPTCNRVIRFFQALFSFVLMFLFGLALRNRFKIS